MSIGKNASTRSEAFVQMVIERLNDKRPDTALRAALRKAENPATTKQSWEYLTRWCDIEDDRKWKPFALVGSAIAWEKPQKNGEVGIGQAIARCYASENKFDGCEKDGAKIKLRRLLACDTIEEACIILRPIIRLINSKNIALNYVELLDNLLSTNNYFNDHIKPQWAKDFFYKPEEEE